MLSNGKTQAYYSDLNERMLRAIATYARRILEVGWGVGNFGIHNSLHVGVPRQFHENARLFTSQ
jgi:hypothetical protein